MTFLDARLPDRFWSNVSPCPMSGCWIWTGGQTKRGYGRFRPARAQLYTHRCAYEALVGPITNGLELDHRCRVTSCCNPAHLEPVTHLENVRRGDSGRHQTLKTHCPKGHALRRAPNSKHRHCYQCGHARKKLRRAKGKLNA